MAARRVAKQEDRIARQWASVCRLQEANLPDDAAMAFLEKLQSMMESLRRDLDRLSRSS
jgi:hypothetical protein